MLALLAAGYTREPAAAELGLAPSTVQGHVARILAALGARNAAHAVAIAHRRGLFAPRRPMAVGTRLSWREHQVLTGIAAGLTAEQFGKALTLSG